MRGGPSAPLPSERARGGGGAGDRPRHDGGRSSRALLSFRLRPRRRGAGRDGRALDGRALQAPRSAAVRAGRVHPAPGDPLLVGADGPSARSAPYARARAQTELRRPRSRSFFCSKDAGRHGGALGRAPPQLRADERGGARVAESALVGLGREASQVPRRWTSLTAGLRAAHGRGRRGLLRERARGRGAVEPPSDRGLPRRGRSVGRWERARSQEPASRPRSASAFTPSCSAPGAAPLTTLRTKLAQVGVRAEDLSTEGDAHELSVRVHAAGSGICEEAFVFVVDQFEEVFNSRSRRARARRRLRMARGDRR